MSTATEKDKKINFKKEKKMKAEEGTEIYIAQETKK